MILDATERHIKETGAVSRPIESAYDNWLDNRKNAIRKINDLIDDINQWRAVVTTCYCSGLALNIVVWYMLRRNNTLGPYGFDMSIIYGMSILSGVFLMIGPLFLEKYHATPKMFQEMETILEQENQISELLPEYLAELQINVKHILANVNQIKNETEGNLQSGDLMNRYKNFFKRTLSMFFNWCIPYYDDATPENAESESQIPGRLTATSTIAIELNLLLLMEDCSLAKAIREHVLYPLKTNTRDIQLKYQNVTHGN